MTLASVQVIFLLVLHMTDISIIVSFHCFSLACCGIKSVMEIASQHALKTFPDMGNMFDYNMILYFDNHRTML